ncbi:MAG: cytochrome C [Ideonella sp.]|jgi:mono/diheme cytochrome c family protein|nr:cytochrome C [Ideonella sp.]
MAGAVVAADDPTRGRLLYETHCIACHNSQMHWRDQRLARDWAGLEQQVRHWQGRANLNWTDDDVLEVVRHLNDRIYRYRAPLPPRSAAPDAATGVQLAAASTRR